MRTLAIVLLISFSGWTHAVVKTPREVLETSSEVRQKLTDLAKLVSRLLDEEYAATELLANKSLLNQTSFNELRPSLGVSVDWEGGYELDKSMVYLWAPRTANHSAVGNSDKVFLNITEAINREKEAMKREKRSPKGGSGGGGRGASGARASSAGRGSSGKFSSGSSSSGYYRSSSTSSGQSYHSAPSYSTWVVVYGHGGSHPGASSWSESGSGGVANDTSVRMEVSICFGKHRTGESCSSKVHDMVEKFVEKSKEESHLAGWIAAISLLAIICCIFLCYLLSKKKERSYGHPSNN